METDEGLNGCGVGVCCSSRVLLERERRTEKQHRHNRGKGHNNRSVGGLKL